MNVNKKAAKIARTRLKYYLDMIQPVQTGMSIDEIEEVIFLAGCNNHTYYSPGGPSGYIVTAEELYTFANLIIKRMKRTQ